MLNHIRIASSRLLLGILCLSLLFLSLHAFSFQLDTRVRVAGSSSIRVAPPEPKQHNDDIDMETSYIQQQQQQQEEGLDLETYMTLPVEQYVLVPMPLNAKLSRQDDAFLLTVPPLQFFSLKVQPLVTAQVQLTPNQVTITSTQCRLQSPDHSESSYLERVQLNDRFQFCATTTLTWNTTEHCIFADTHIQVDVDPPPPFGKLPRRLLETTGNAAMRISMNYIIQSFLRGLAQDYQKWAHNSEYRQARESLSASIVQQQ